MFAVFLRISCQKMLAALTDRNINVRGLVSVLEKFMLSLRIWPSQMLDLLLR